MLVNIAYYGCGMMAHICYPEFFQNDVVVVTGINRVTQGKLRVTLSPHRVEGQNNEVERVEFETQNNEYLFFRPHWDPEGCPMTTIVFTIPGNEDEAEKLAGTIGVSLFRAGIIPTDPRFLPFPGIETIPRLQINEVSNQKDCVFEISLGGMDIAKGRLRKLVDVLGPETNLAPGCGLSVWDRLE